MTQHESPPKLPFLHMWTDDQGRSRIDRTFMTGFAKQSISHGADPQWLRAFPGEVSGVKFAVLPPGWVGEWHESPAPQWVVATQGAWFIETQDGARVEMGPGEIHFGQDLDTQPDGGRRGHRSGTLGDEPCFQMIVQFATSPLARTKDPLA